MWNPQKRLEFFGCIDDLLMLPEVRAMNRIPAHHTTNCYEHSIYVAYLSFLFCKRWHLDYLAAARGGLLHDLFLYDQRNKDSHPGFHIFAHPRAALENAERITALTDKERDIIRNHMWPVNRSRPHCLESFVVSTADKICAAAEALFMYRWMKVNRHLSFTPALLSAVIPVSAASRPSR